MVPPPLPHHLLLGFRSKGIQSMITHILPHTRGEGCFEDTLVCCSPDFCGGDVGEVADLMEGDTEGGGRRRREEEGGGVVSHGHKE